jgi:hypothetical protein
MDKRLGMKQVIISFHRPSLWRQHWLGFLCLFLGLLMAAGTTWFGSRIYAQHVRWNTYLAALRNEGSTHRTNETIDDKEAIKAQIQAANEVIGQLDTPWAELFSVLEGAYSDNATLLGADPDPVARSVRLSAEAKDMGSMLAFVRLLRQSKVLGDAYVISHAVNQQDAQRPIRFVVSSHWLDAPEPMTSPETSPSTTTPVAMPEKGKQQ